MRNPITLLLCLAPFLRLTTIRQLSRVSQAILTMTGRVTMQGMARWSGTGGSYRTIQRFFATVLPWEVLFWVFFCTHLRDPDDVYLVGAMRRSSAKRAKRPTVSSASFPAWRANRCRAWLSSRCR
jgi:putative transposase